ncbi:MAG: flagellar basal body rod protein FlgB [Haliea sp.]|uniref:flagellar basal body rod protein FlgB n=1 Tax=Haliea sp. TaxID=1932666 RepID=UPI0032EECA61
MSFTDRVFGASGQAMALRAQRLELIAANLANQDTPGYKARDIDFVAAMQAATASGLRRTHARHLDASGGMAGSNEQPLLYRVPNQPSLDGNTVDAQREHAEFMDNAIRYQASLTILDSRIKSTQRAIRGE